MVDDVKVELFDGQDAQMATPYRFCLRITATLLIGGSVIPRDQAFGKADFELRLSCAAIFNQGTAFAPGTALAITDENIVQGALSTITNPTTAGGGTFSAAAGTNNTATYTVPTDTIGTTYYRCVISYAGYPSAGKPAAADVTSNVAQIKVAPAISVSTPTTPYTKKAGDDLDLSICGDGWWSHIVHSLVQKHHRHRGRCDYQRKHYRSR